MSSPKMKLKLKDSLSLFRQESGIIYNNFDFIDKFTKKEQVQLKT
jgi:ABC-type lipoprotein export system ATPase subunit